MAQAADRDDRVLITKDGDFRDGHRLGASPRRLLIVTIGNLGNDELLAIFARHLGLLVTALGRPAWSSSGTTASRLSKSGN